ncbi:MAG: hypothetical protein LUQ69_09720 [Methanoregulaceae archaeon]|nr:hypothetical protein [Methanoregulaceae archaeon]
MATTMAEIIRDALRKRGILPAQGAQLAAPTPPTTSLQQPEQAPVSSARPSAILDVPPEPALGLEEFSRPSRDILDALGVENRAGVLDALGGFAESFGNFRPVTTGDILYRRPQQEPFQATSIRRSQALEEDRMQPEMAQALNKALQQDFFRPGMPTSGVSKLFPGLVNLSENRLQLPMKMAALANQIGETEDRQEYRESLMTQRKEELARKKVEDERKAARFKITNELADRRLAMPAQSVIDQMADIDLAQTKLAEISTHVDDFVTGTFKGRWARFANRLGIASPEQAKSIAALQSAINDLIYASTGKQLNQEEMVRISETMPRMESNPEAFKAVLAQAQGRLKQKRESILKINSQAGKNVSGWSKIRLKDKTTGKVQEFDTSDPQVASDVQAVIQSGEAEEVK